MGILDHIQVSEVDGELLGSQSTQLALAEGREKLRRAVVDRLGLEEVARLAQDGATERARTELAVACEAVLNDGTVPEGDSLGRERLIGWVVDGICGLGPLQPLLDDPRVTEIMVNGPGSLFFEQDGKLHDAGPVFDTPEQIMLVVDRILAPLGRRLDESSPLVSARLANGDRVNAVINPVAIEGPVVTIRRFTGRITSLERLVELGSLPPWYAQLLMWAVRCRADIAVAGGTGSGKTTLLNALSCCIPDEERIITIEDSAELSFETHPHVVRLEARDASIEGRGEVTIRDLVINALRMRPDRIVVGEVRGAECIDMLQAMSTGHDGSLTTLHAGSEQEAISRLVLMARFGMDLPADLIEEQVASAIDLVVMGRRLSGGARRVTSMSLVCHGPQGGVALQPLVTYDEGQDQWHLAAEPPFISEGVRLGILDGGEVARWRSMCS